MRCLLACERVTSSTFLARISHQSFMLRSDTIVFSRLVDREPKPARLKGAEPCRGGQLGAKPDPALQR